MYGKKLAYGVKIKFIIKKFLYAQSIVEYFRYYQPEMIMPKKDSEDLNKSTEIAYKWLVETVKEYFPLVVFIGLILTGVFIGLSRI